MRPRAARRRDRTATRQPLPWATADPGTSTVTTDQPEHWRDTGKLPARPGEHPPRDTGLIRVIVPGARRLMTRFAAPADRPGNAFRDAWSI